MAFVEKQNPGETSNTMNTSPLYVEGDLKINSQLRFELHNLSTLRQDKSSNLINSLDELAKGICIKLS